MGVLHTIMPCEDKFIFCFYAFGVARDWRQAFRIVNFYGAGLFLMNLIIGIFISYVGSFIGNFIPSTPWIWHSLAAISFFLSGIIMLIQIKKKTYWPHSEQFQDLTESIGTLKFKKRTAFLLGLIAGIPPCIFELGVFSTTITISLEYGWEHGVWVLFFFGIGTWIGLYPLAFIGSASGKLSKSMTNSSIQRFQSLIKRKKRNKQEYGSYNIKEINPEKDLINNDQILKKDEELSSVNYSKMEFFSAWSLIVFGVIFSILSIFNVNLIPSDDVTHVPWPFESETITIFWIILFVVIGGGILSIFLILWIKNRKFMKKIR